MRMALAQLNPIVGDVAGNAAQVLHAIEEARRERADVLVTSELALIGYPPRDLLFREDVVDACERAVRDIAKHAGDLHVLVGHPRRSPSESAAIRKPFRNSVSVCHRDQVIAVYDKRLLPGYDVFDEDRYFEPGEQPLVLPIRGKRVAILICEDLWRAKDVHVQGHYSIEPVRDCMASRCDLIISLNASPFVIGKWQKHINQMANIAREIGIPIVAVNQVGANDDLVFDGRSCVIARDGGMVALLPGFESAVHTVELNSMHEHSKSAATIWQQPEAEIYHALVLAVRDYVHKTGNNQVFIGLSGGIDSALVAVLAAAAIGAKHVHGVMMPSMYSSEGSITDARDLAQRLNLASCREISIHAVHDAMTRTIAAAQQASPQGVTDENMQSRIRGMILMALSNSTRGSLVLSTANKSEAATGYSTLYGDMCGALAVLGDLLKTRIYSLARWINQHHQACGFAQPPIPENSITKLPSAELRPNQTDQDSLPAYEVLDEIVERFIEHEQSEATIIQDSGFDPDLVRKTLLMIDRAQYKRDQAPVIPKLTPRAFGPGRSMPIVMKASNLRLAIDDLRCAQTDNRPLSGSRSVPVSNRLS